MTQAVGQYFMYGFRQSIFLILLDIKKDIKQAKAVKIQKNFQLQLIPFTTVNKIRKMSRVGNRKVGGHFLLTSIICYQTETIRRMPKYSEWSKTDDQNSRSLLKKIMEWVKGDVEICEYLKIDQICQQLTSQIQTQNMVIRFIKHILQQSYDYYQIQFQERTLKLVNALFETCEHHTILLIQVYILPTIYKLIRQYIEEERGGLNEKAKYINNRIDMKQGLFKKSLQYVLVWSSVKPKRVYEDRQMKEDSVLLKTLNSVKQLLQQKGESVSDKDLCYMYGICYRNVNNRTKKLKSIYLSNLQSSSHFDTLREFSQFYMNKLIQEKKSVYSQTPTNIHHHHISHHISQQLPELTYTQLYMTLDIYLTSPLIKHILQQLSYHISQTHIIYLHIISDLIKWADLQAYLAVLYSDTMLKIATKICQLQGHKGLSQGVHLYSEIDGRLGQKVYVQFLRMLDIFMSCRIEQEMGGQDTNMRVIYGILKDKRFIFPQNLMLSKISEEFMGNMKNNIERNCLVLNTIKMNSSSYPSTTNANENMNRIMGAIQQCMGNRVQSMEQVQCLYGLLQQFASVYEQEVNKAYNIQGSRNIHYILKGQYLLNMHEYIKEHHEHMQTHMQSINTKIQQQYAKYLLCKRQQSYQSLQYIQQQQEIQESSKQSINLLLNSRTQQNQLKTKYNHIDNSYTITDNYSHSSKTHTHTHFKLNRHISNRITTIINTIKDTFNPSPSSNALSQLVQPSLSPSIISHQDNNTNICMFRQCMNIQRQLIKQNIFQKVYLRKRTISNYNSLSSKEKNENLTTKQSQSCQQKTIIKHNTQSSIQLHKGRLINMNTFDYLFKKLPSHLPSKSLISNHVTLYQDKYLTININFNSYQHQLPFIIEIISFQQLSNIQLQQSPTLFSIIQFKIFNLQRANSSYLIRGIATILNLQQLYYPIFTLAFTCMGIQRQIHFTIPLNIHHFTTYQLISNPKSKPNANTCTLRTDLFRLQKDLGLGQIQKLIPNSRIVKQKQREQQVLGVQAYLPFHPLKLQIFIKVREKHIQIYGISEFKKTQAFQSLLSTLRFALQQHY